jgi:hypothetical protein
VPLDEGLEDAVAEVAFEFADRCAANGWQVSAAIFVAVLTEPAVKALLRVGVSRQGGTLRFGVSAPKAETRPLLQQVRATVRHVLRSNFQPSFFAEEPEFADFDVEALARVAQSRPCGKPLCLHGAECNVGSCVHAASRAKAIRWLVKYFPIQAKELAQRQEHVRRREHECLQDISEPGPRQPWQEYWDDLLTQAVRTGVVRKRTVCCKYVAVRLPLRPDCRPVAMTPHVLPSFESCGSLLV